MSATIGTGERGHDLRERLGGLLLVARATHDVAARGGERVDLGERAVDVGGLGRRHRLDRDRRVATDGNPADHHLAGRPTRSHASQPKAAPLRPDRAARETFTPRRAALRSTGSEGIRDRDA